MQAICFEQYPPRISRKSKYSGVENEDIAWRSWENTPSLHTSLYSRVPLKRGTTCHDNANDTALTATEDKCDFKHTTDTPYLALTGELWGVHYENFEENWPRYNGTALYSANYCRCSLPLVSHHFSNSRFEMCFPRHRLQREPLASDPGMHHVTCVTHVGIAKPRWRGKRSRHSRRMRNPQFCVSDKRTMGWS